MGQIARADMVYLPTIVLGELEAAFRLGQRASENRSRLEDFTSEDVWIAAFDSDFERIPPVWFDRTVFAP